MYITNDVYELYRLYINYDYYFLLYQLCNTCKFMRYCMWCIIYCLDNEYERTYMKQRLPHFPARYPSYMFQALMKWVLVLASMPTARGVVGEMPLVYWIGCQSYPLCQTRWTLEGMGKHPMALLRSKHCFLNFHGVGFWTCYYKWISVKQINACSVCNGSDVA